MPVTYNRPGTRHPVAAATRARQHRAPCFEENYAGIAQKQKQPTGDVGLLNNVQTTIAVGERFVMIVKGIVEVAAIGGAVRGDTVWINKTNDALTLTDPGGGNGFKYGRVVALPGQEGVPTGLMRVDLDVKGTF